MNFDDYDTSKGDRYVELRPHVGPILKGWMRPEQVERLLDHVRGNAGDDQGGRRAVEIDTGEGDVIYVLLHAIGTAFVHPPREY